MLAIWENGRYPDVIVELLSPTTADIDRGAKKELYERTFRTPEYFCYEPATQKLEGWRLWPKGRYEPILPDERGRLECEELQLWLGPWSGKYLNVDGTFPRFYGPDGELVATVGEGATQRADQAEAQLALFKAQLAKLEAATLKRPN